MERAPAATGEDPAHAALLATARQLRQAVIDDDTEQVHRLLCRLRAELAPHVVSEHDRLPLERGSLSAIVVHGQRRLLKLVDEALLGDGEGDGCNCLVRAVEIEIALRRQIRLEATVLEPHGGNGPGGDL